MSSFICPSPFTHLETSQEVKRETKQKNSLLNWKVGCIALAVFGLAACWYFNPKIREALALRDFKLAEKLNTEADELNLEIHPANKILNPNSYDEIQRQATLKQDLLRKEAQSLYYSVFAHCLGIDTPLCQKLKEAVAHENLVIMSKSCYINFKPACSDILDQFIARVPGDTLSSFLNAHCSFPVRPKETIVYTQKIIKKIGEASLFYLLNPLKSLEACFAERHEEQTAILKRAFQQFSISDPEKTNDFIKVCKGIKNPGEVCKLVAKEPYNPSFVKQLKDYLFGNDIDEMIRQINFFN